MFGATDRFRGEAHEIVHICTALYSPKAVCSLLVIGFDSKNKRVFSECLTEVGNMIVKYGMTVCDTKKVLPTIAMTAGANESHVRAAALGALGAIYQAIGSAIWQHLGGQQNNAKIPPKSMALIEARFKTIKPNVAEEATPVAPAAVEKKRPATASTAIDAPATPKKKLPAASPQASPSNSLAPGTSRSAHVSPRNSIAPSGGVPTPQRRTAARDVQVPNSARRPATTASAPVSAGTLEGGLPNCFSLDLEGPGLDTSMVSRTAPSSPTGSARNSISGPSSHMTVPTAQSAHTSPHNRNASVGSAAVFSHKSRPQLVLPVKAADPALVEQLHHYLDSKYSASLTEEERMEVMKQLWEIVIERAGMLIGQGDEITLFLMKQVDLCFVEKDGVLTINHRLCRYALNTLLELFKVEEVAIGVKMSTLDTLTRMLLLKLMDERLKSHPDQQCRSLTMAVNVLVLKVLENGDRTSIFHILLNCLQTGTGTGIRTDAKNRTFVDLVVRSLMKLAKNLSNPTFLQTLQIPKLMQTIHEFMVAHPAAVAGDDLPIKAVKAILTNLVNAKENDIRADCAGIPKDSPAMLFVEKMIAYNAKQKAGGAGAATPTAATPKASPTVPTASATTAATDQTARKLEMDAAATEEPAAEVDPVQQQLISIVARTIKPATTQPALADLYALTLAHPNLDIWPAFKAQGDSFRAYVKRSLARMAEASAATTGGKTTPAATTAPVVTPSASLAATPSTLAPLPSPSSSPAGSPAVVRTSLAPTGSPSTPAGSEASSTAAYRQRLSQLVDRAKLATGGAPAPAAATPTTTSTISATPAATAPVVASTSGSATIDAIRARFKSAAKSTDENSVSAMTPATPSDPPAVPLAQQPVVQQAAPPKPSSIDAIKARIAAMNQKTAS